LNISGATIKLSSEDIKSIVDDFLKVPGLSITSIGIEKSITIYGSFKKLVRISFVLTVSIVEIKRNSIALKLDKAQIVKMPVFNWVKNIALKKIVKTLKDYGISYKEEKVELYLPELLKNLPIGLSFFFKSIELQKEHLSIEAEKIVLNISSGVKTEERLQEGQASQDMLHKMESTRKEDIYGKVRNSIDERVSGKFRGLLPYIMIMPDIAALFIRLFKDKRVPMQTKLLCGSVIGYLALPLDILPDFLPVIGKIDDVALAFFALDKILCSLPKEIIIDNWQGKEDIIMFIRTGTDYLYRVIGTSNIV
jgi:Uncharacterized conserved protein